MTPQSLTPPLWTDPPPHPPSLARRAPAKATVPEAPIGVTATPCLTTDNCATGTWLAPASDGGSPITGYEFMCTSPSGLVVGPQTYPGTATGTGKDGFTGLLTGVPYTCSATAVNAVGAGPASAPSNQIVNEDTFLPPS